MILWAANRHFRQESSATDAGPVSVGVQFFSPGGTELSLRHSSAERALCPIAVNIWYSRKSDHAAEIDWTPIEFAGVVHGLEVFIEPVSEV
jgi:hypothetical protein